MKECRECEYFNGYDYDDGTILQTMTFVVTEKGGKIDGT